MPLVPAQFFRYPVDTHMCSIPHPGGHVCVSTPQRLPESEGQTAGRQKPLKSSGDPRTFQLVK